MNPLCGRLALSGRRKEPKVYRSKKNGYNVLGTSIATKFVILFFWIILVFWSFFCFDSLWSALGSFLVRIKHEFPSKPVHGVQSLVCSLWWLLWFSPGFVNRKWFGGNKLQRFWIRKQDNYFQNNRMENVCVIHKQVATYNHQLRNYRNPVNVVWKPSGFKHCCLGGRCAEKGTGAWGRGGRVTGCGWWTGAGGGTGRTLSETTPRRFQEKKHHKVSI